MLVAVKANGICHTDGYTLSGADPKGIFPSIHGHEGAGVILEVGIGVTSLKRADHVMPLYRMGSAFAGARGRTHVPKIADW